MSNQPPFIQTLLSDSEPPFMGGSDSSTPTLCVKCKSPTPGAWAKFCKPCFTNSSNQSLEFACRDCGRVSKRPLWAASCKRCFAVGKALEDIENGARTEFIDPPDEWFGYRRRELLPVFDDETEEILYYQDGNNPEYERIIEGESYDGASSEFDEFRETPFQEKPAYTPTDPAEKLEKLSERFNAKYHVS